MDKTTFEIADKFLDNVAETTDRLLDSKELDGLRNLLIEMNKALGERYSIGLAVHVEMFDREKDRCLPLLQTGLAGFSEGEPYKTWADSTAHKYVTDDGVQIVPHDYCPTCWEVWDLKFQKPSCSHCGATMGNEVKILLDTDVCPPL